MERYIGIDVHAQSCTIAVMSAAGKRLNQLVVETNGHSLRNAIGCIPGHLHICLEEGTQSAWVFEILKGFGEVVVTVPEPHLGNKDDARDAWALAELLRTGAIRRRVYKDCAPYSELRAAMRSYTMLRDDVCRTKARLKATFRSRGLMPPGEAAYHSKRSQDWARQLPPEERQTAAMLLEQLLLQEAMRSKAEARVAAAAKKHPVVKLVASAPGIGPIRSAQIVATVVTPHRFRTKRQFWSYCGLAVVMRSSANWERDQRGRLVRTKIQQTRGLNQNRSAVLKDVFKGAAHQLSFQMVNHPLHLAYVRLVDGGMKPNLAKVTIARRIAAVVLAMWKHGEVYEPDKHVSKITAEA